MRLGLSLFPAIVFLVGLSCSSDVTTPEQQVRALLESAEAAAEEKDLPALKKMISDSYRDDLGNDRQAVLAMVRYHFLRNDAVHLLTRTGTVAFPTPSVAHVTVFAAMAGEPIPTSTDLAALRADLYRFDLTFEAGGEASWRLIRAAWRRAGPADLL